MEKTVSVLDKSGNVRRFHITPDVIDEIRDEAHEMGVPVSWLVRRYLMLGRLVDEGRISGLQVMN